MDRRIYGLETEYAIAFEPDSARHWELPRRKDLYKVFREVLRGRFALIPALYKKEGDFVENGSLVHYEAQIQHFQDGLIEWATPECSSPLEAVAYSKAQEAVLLDVQEECREELAGRGYDGHLRVLKNNVDLEGNNYGCHENYHVVDRRAWWREGLKGICFALFWVLFLPFYVLPRLFFLLFLTLLLLLLLLYFTLHVLTRVPLVGWLLEPVAGGVDTFLARYGTRLDEEMIKNLALFMEFLYLPFVVLYSGFCRLFVFERYRRDLTAFLVTRQLYAGSGRVHPTADGSLFWISQKAEFVDSVMRVFWNQRQKPIFDIKTYLLEPLSFFARHKRLHLLIGDSNLAEPSEYLKLATTGLVIQLLEEGGGTELPQLVDPIAAIRQVATDVTLAGRLPCRDGVPRTAIELQRLYLDAARRHFAERRTLPIWAPMALRRWDDVLERLERAPGSLHQEVDWVIKRRLMDRLLWGRMSWDELARWAPALALLLRKGLPEYAYPQPEELLRQLEEALSPRLRRQLDARLAAAGLEREGLVEALSLLLALKKIDLRYHELSPEGYFLQLKAEGLVETLLTPEEIEQAQVDPPRRTRARLRGEFIKLAHRRKLTALVGWTKIKTYNARKVIRMRDPFSDDLGPLSTLR